MISNMFVLIENITANYNTYVTINLEIKHTNTKHVYDRVTPSLSVSSSVLK